MTDLVQGAWAVAVLGFSMGCLLHMARLLAPRVLRVLAVTWLMLAVTRPCP